MRTGGTLYFMLGDHLGSTSLTTFANGNVVSETRYKAWGEARYASGNIPTQYQYTGQYSHDSDFGLHYYNARWYDSSLSRFAQADSIIPGGVQGYDRYAYVGNNPIKYNDPSGHYMCNDSDNGECSHYTISDQINDLKTMIKDQFNWNITGKWGLKNLETVYEAGQDVENYVDGLTGGKGNAWMKKYLDGINLNLWSDPYRGQTLPNWLGGMDLPEQGFDKYLFTHELGHVWDINTGRQTLWV